MGKSVLIISESLGSGEKQSKLRLPFSSDYLQASLAFRFVIILLAFRLTEKSQFRLDKRAKSNANDANAEEGRRGGGEANNKKSQQYVRLLISDG